MAGTFLANKEDRMAVTGELVYELDYEGKKYRWRSITDLEVGFLRQCKAWFGPEYGALHSFNRLWFEADVEAVLCVLWGAAEIAAREANDPSLKLPEPNKIPNFSVGEFLQTSTFEAAKGTGKPKGRATTQTRGSTKTSTNSEESGSGQ